MGIWGALGAAVVVACIVTTPTFQALVRPTYRARSLMMAGFAVADEVHGRWPGATAVEGERMAWARYRLRGLGPLDHGLSFTEFRRHRRVVLAASVALGRGWQRLADRRYPRGWHGTAGELGRVLWFRIRVLVWPDLLLARSGWARLPRLPIRARFRRAHPGHAGRWRYNVRAPYACLGEHGYRSGWHRRPVWDDDWERLMAALIEAGLWTDHESATPLEAGESRTPPPLRPPLPNRHDIEAWHRRQMEAIERLSDQLKELAGDLIELAEARLSRSPDSRERPDAPAGDPPGGPPSGPSGGSGGSSHGDDWGSDSWSDGGWGGGGYGSDTYG